MLSGASKIPSEDFGLASLVARPRLSIERRGHHARSSAERPEKHIASLWWESMEVTLVALSASKVASPDSWARGIENKKRAPITS